MEFVRISRADCALCHLPLQHGDEFITVVGSLAYHGYTSKSTWPASSSDKLFLHTEKGVFEVELFSYHGTNEAFPLHIKCYSALKSVVNSDEEIGLCDIWAFALAGLSEYKCSVASKILREKATWEIALTAKCQSLIERGPQWKLLQHVAKLPLELQFRITQDSWPCNFQSIATIIVETSHSIKSIKQQPEEFSELDLRRDISVSRVDYNGRSYISRLINKPIEKNATHPTEAPCSDIIVEMDELGVLDILTGSRRGHTKDTSIWYKVFRKETLGRTNVISNTLFVTDVLPTRGHNFVWNTLHPPDPEPENIYEVHPSDSNKVKRFHMRNISFHEDICGIAVSCIGHMIRGIYPRTTSGWKFDTIEDVSDREVWIYFPIGKGERITKVWLRELKTTLDDRHSTLMLETNAHRRCDFGRFISTSEYKNYTFRGLGMNLKKIDSLCYNDPTKTPSVCLMAVAGRQGLENIWGPPEPISDISPPSDFAVSQWHYSAASVEDIVAIEKCTDESKVHKPCIGILIRFKDMIRSHEVLGQWRHDRTICEVAGVGEYLRFQIAYSNSLPYVANVRLSDCIDTASTEDVFIPLRGKIIWWFDYGASVIQHVP